MWHCPIWEQILEVAQALHRIAAGVFGSSNEAHHDLMGCNFDLKPTNILINEQREKCILKITDFGQAKFKRASGGNSNMRGKGGDEEYTPPEMDNGAANEQEQNPQTWCLLFGMYLLGTYLLHRQTPRRGSDTR